jgi:acyl dehydratase
LTPLSKIATTQTLVKWAGASGDLNPLHYDAVFTKSLGSAGTGTPIIHGALKRQWLIHLVTAWMGDEGELRKFSCRYRAVDYPRPMKTTSEPEDGDTWTCKGKVTRKYVQDGRNLVDCEIRVENGAGEVSTSGKATVMLPARG